MESKCNVLQLPRNLTLFSGLYLILTIKTMIMNDQNIAAEIIDDVLWLTSTLLAWVWLSYMPSTPGFALWVFQYHSIIFNKSCFWKWGSQPSIVGVSFDFSTTIKNLSTLTTAIYDRVNWFKLRYRGWWCRGWCLQLFILKRSSSLQ